MGMPGTLEQNDPNDPSNTIFRGIHVGGQGSVHSSLVADPFNEFIVYIGGDRQPHAILGDDTFFPNSIGALTFSGRLFRGDASRTASNQWFPLTHIGTANNTSAHADSRDMAFAANGVLLEADDGGIYMRTSPQDDTGDWFSLNGNMQNTEIHSAAYDSNSNILAGGTQDNGQGNQLTSDGTQWEVLIGGDGGDFIIDNQTLSGLDQSIRYTSLQYLGRFTRYVVDQHNEVLSLTHPSLMVVSGDKDPIGQFLTPVAINSMNADRLIFGFSNDQIDQDNDNNYGGVYESFDQGDTLVQLNPAGIEAFGIQSNSISAGGPNNEELLYVAAGEHLYRRTVAGQALQSVFKSNNTIAAVCQDEHEGDQAFFIELRGSVYKTTNTGDIWIEIGENLSDLDPGRLWAIKHISNPQSLNDILAVGADRGVFIAQKKSEYKVWQKLASIPNVPVFGMNYNQNMDELMVNTLGRGTFVYTPLFDHSSDVIFENGFE